MRPAPAAPARSGSVWRHRDFLFLWGGQAVSETGSAITLLALPLIAVVVLRASTFEVALLSALGTLAFLLVSLPAGALVDRLPKRRTMLVCDVARALLLLAVPIAAAANVLSMWQLYAVTVLFGVLTVVFDVAYQSYLPSLLSKDLLVDGNGKLGTTASLAQVIGPGLAGALVSVLGATRTVIVDSVSFVVSALTLAQIKTPDPLPATRDGKRASLRAEIGEGMSFVARHSILRRVVACTATSNFFSTMSFAIATVFLVRELRVSSVTLGLVFAVSSLGGVVAGLTAGWLTRRIGTARIIWVAPLCFGWADLLMPLARPGWGVSLVVAGWGISSAIAVVYNTAQVSYRQATTPPALLGRMNATVRWVVWGAMPIGSLVGGALATWIGIRNTLWIAGAGAWSAGLWVFLSPLRHMRDFDDAAEVPSLHEETLAFAE